MRPSPPASTRAALRGDDGAVTPIIGTVFILGITVVGMTAVLLMGAPVIAGLQDQAALRTVINQFGQVRHDVASLSIEEASKAPGLTLPAGSMSIEAGDAFLVAVGAEAALPACDYHLQRWLEAGGSGDQEVLLSSSPAGCRAPVASGCGAGSACFEAHRLEADGTLTAMQVTVASTPGACLPASVPQCHTITLQSTTAPFPDVPIGQADWRFRLTNGGATVYAEMALLRTQNLHWKTASAAGGADATFEAGAIFTSSRGGQYLEANPPLREAATGDLATDQFHWRFPALKGNPSGSFSGQESRSVLLRLDDTALLLQAPGARLLRIDVQGPLSTAWCNALLLRNALQALPTSGGQAFQYAADATFPCATGDTQSQVRSATYQTSGNAAFAFQLVHARFLASFQA